VPVEIDVLEAGAAEDDGLVRTLVRLINRAYALGESGLRLDGAPRTTAEEIAAKIRRGEMLVATIDGRVVGCGSAWPIDETTAELGFVATDPERWGGGVGREIVRVAEELMHSRGAETMQLEVLVPQAGAHPAKDRLGAWYARQGYRVVGTARFEDVVEDDPALHLATPCEFRVLAKPLAG
jgi:GNAT superfamily N-acetyltransferase